MRALLLSKPEGIYLDQLCREYETLINKSLYFRDLGYHNLEAFVRAIPDIARQGCSVRILLWRLRGFVCVSMPVCAQVCFSSVT